MLTVPRYVRPLTLAFTMVFAVGAFALSGCTGAGSSKTGVETMTAATLHGKIVLGAAPVIVDVRTPGEFASGHIPGAINIPYDQMEARVSEIIAYKDEPVVMYCRSGRRSGIAAPVLVAQGFASLALLEGDMPGWDRAGYPVER
jgi:phage shock protein E